MHKKIKQGTKITCPECDEVIAVANTDIDDDELLRAELFDYPSAKHMNNKECICHRCGSEYVRVVTFKRPQGMIHTEHGWL